MTVCNMSIEAGARAGMIAPDETTFDYIKGRKFAPQGADWDAAVADWKIARHRPGRRLRQVAHVRRGRHRPAGQLGHQPGPGRRRQRRRSPSPADFADPTEQKTTAQALEYMGISAGTPITDLAIDRVFIGSCTNGRIEDLRAAAAVAKGHKVADHVDAMVVPGSGVVKQQAEEEGLDAVFKEAGFDWREAGCSMCLAMNPDKLEPGERCASTSNRNFEGRQGRGGRTHLVSPAMAAAAACAGHALSMCGIGARIGY